MDRWTDFGWLDKAATVSFVGGLPGMALVVLLTSLLGKEWVGPLLFLWFAPTLIWLFCFWSVMSRDHFPQTAGFLAGLCVLSAFTQSVDEGELVLSIGVAVGASAIAAVVSPLTKPLLNFGRSEYSKH